MERQTEMIEYEDDLPEDGETCGKPKRRKPYVKNSELYDELVKWRDSNENVELRIPSEKLGDMFLKIATHYLDHPNYVRYPKQIKEDIIGESCIGMLSALPHYDFEKKNPFAYFTQVCWSHAMTYLAKYYKDMNFMREQTKLAIERMIAEGVNTQNGEFYLKILNDFTPEFKDSDSETIKQNERFIYRVMGGSEQTSDPENDEAESDEDEQDEY